MWERIYEYLTAIWLQCNVMQCSLYKCQLCGENYLSNFVMVFAENFVDSLENTESRINPSDSSVTININVNELIKYEENPKIWEVTFVDSSEDIVDMTANLIVILINIYSFRTVNLLFYEDLQIIWN